MDLKEKLKKQISKKNVIAINGSFGIGKTTFIDNFIKESSDDMFIKFNAWEFDFSDNPKASFLLSVYKELHSSLSKKNKLKDLGIKGFEIIKALITNGLKHKGVDATINESQIKEEFNNFETTNKLIEKIRNNIEEICKSHEGNVVLVIDDLDRARPDFSLEILEISKHIFDVKNLSVILIYNNETMAEIIEKRFGAIEGEAYIEKYIDQKIDYDRESLFGMLMKDLKLHRIHMTPIIFNKLSFYHPVSWRQVEKVKKNYDYMNFFKSIKMVGYSVGWSYLEITLFSILIFFKWFYNDNPFIETDDERINGLIKIKSKYIKSIASCFQGTWFGILDNYSSWKKYGELILLTKIKGTTKNIFHEELSYFSDYIKNLEK
ncbi:MAG: AAA family ATPase [Mycoplasma sp.]|nr:AAA family ATPase [Mycoplasma sp.]